MFDGGCAGFNVGCADRGQIEADQIGTTASGGESTSYGFPEESDCVMQVAWIIENAVGQLHGGTASKYRFLVDGGDASHTVVFQNYSHTVLTQYMGGKLPMPGTACPEDRPRVNWQKYVSNMTAAPYQPSESRNKDNINLLPFSSSYQLMPTAWIKDGPTRALTPSGLERRQLVISQAGTHDRYQTYHKVASYGGRKHDEIAYPSQKVAVADSHQRHVGRTDLFYAYKQAIQPLLFWDGSVNEHTTGDAQLEWNPLKPGGTTTRTTFLYEPDLGFESPKVGGSSDQTVVTGYYKWTRGGLRGVDYSGAEISTKAW